MALSNQDRGGKATELLRAGLAPLAEREFASLHEGQAAEAACCYAVDHRTIARSELGDRDVGALLKLGWEAWNCATEEVDLWDGALALAKVERTELPLFPMICTGRAGAQLLRLQGSI